VLDSITQTARDAVTTLGYPGIFAAMVAENLFPPIPSELVLPLAGFEVDSGDLSFLLVVAAATLGSLAGALILYAIGLYGGRPAVLKWGRVLRVSPADLDRAEDWFDRWGDWVVLVARVIPIARSLVSIPAGMMRMGLVRFIALTTLGSLAWNLVLVGAGYQLGANWEDVTSTIERYSSVIRALAVLAVLAAVVVGCLAGGHASRPAFGAGTGAHGVTAVPADVLERPQLTVVVPHDEHRIRPATVFEVVTRFGHVVDGAGELPDPRPHLLDLERGELRRVVARRRNQGRALRWRTDGVLALGARLGGWRGCVGAGAGLRRLGHDSILWKKSLPAVGSKRLGHCVTLLHSPL
jgi:membrane protein DedA with SNARE-associated domain